MYSPLTQITYSAQSKAIAANTLLATVNRGPGVAVAILVSSHTNGTIKLWDSLTATGTVLLDTYTYPAGSSTIPLHGAIFVTGLFADMGGTTQKITVLWNI